MRMDIRETIRKAPYFSKGNIDEGLYQQLTKLRETLCKREAGDAHQLNTGNVSGIWLLTGLKYEEGQPQILIRSSLNRAAYERRLLNSEIFDFIKHDVTYDFDEDIMGGDTLIQGQQAELFAEIEAGRILVIYDKEREQ